MSTPLPRALELVKASYNDTKQFSHELMKLNLITFIAPLVGALLGASVITAIALGGRMSAILIGFIAFIAMMILSMWYAAHYVLRVTQLLKGNKEPLNPKTSWEKVPSLIWTTVLHIVCASAIPFAAFVLFLLTTAGIVLSRASGAGLAQAFNVGIGFGGVILVLVGLVCWIYAVTRLQFTSMACLSDNKRGMEALKYSWELSRGRFWSIVWRLMVLIALVYAVMIVTTILTAILGQSALADVLRAIITVGVEAFLVLPVAMFFQVRMYNAYSETK